MCCHGILNERNDLNLQIIVGIFTGEYKITKMNTSVTVCCNYSTTSGNIWFLCQVLLIDILISYCLERPLRWLI